MRSPARDQCALYRERLQVDGGLITEIEAVIARPENEAAMQVAVDGYAAAINDVGNVTVPANYVAPWTDLHAQLFTIEGGRISHIEDLVRREPYGQRSGWPAWLRTNLDGSR